MLLIKQTTCFFDFVISLVYHAPLQYYKFICYLGQSVAQAHYDQWTGCALSSIFHAIIVREILL